MEALLSWPTLAVVFIALAIVILAYWVIGRIRFTFRFRGAVTVSHWSQKPCPHLGLGDEPFIHRDEPSEEHRCYLWMQRDRIDLTHQKGFCLSSAHSHCPWLSIAPPVTAEAGGGLKSGVATTAVNAWGASSKVASASAIRLILASAKVLSTAGRETSARAPGVKGAIGHAAMTLGRALLFGLRAALAFAIGGSKALVQATRSRRPQSEVGASPTNVMEPEIAAAPSPPMPIEQATLTLVAETQPRTPEQGAMSHVESLIEQGKAAGVDGNRKLGHTFFSLAIELEPDNDEAWLWKGALTDSGEEKLACIQKALAINPGNTRAQQALQQMTKGPQAEESQAATATKPRRASSKRGARPHGEPEILTSEKALMEAALAAMENGDEERAYRFFVSATELNEANEAAWFWRAKTANTLDEVIQCLEHALTINPANEKVKANLVWAIQRQQREETAVEAERSRQEEEASEEDRSRPGRSLAATGSRFMAGVLCMALAVYWISAAFLPLLNTPVLPAEGIAEGVQAAARIDLESARPVYLATSRWLPEWNWASSSWYSGLEITSGYNLLEIVPYIVGFLYLFIAIGLFRRESWAPWWGSGMTILSLALGLVFFSNSQATVLVTALGVVALLMLVASRSEYGPEPGEA